MALPSKLNILASVFFIFILSRCVPVTSENHQILVIYDVTGSTEQQLPSPKKVLEDISKIYPLDDDNYMYDGFDVGITFFDELSSGRIKHKSFKPAQGSAASVNPKKRKRELEEYFDLVKRMFSKALSSTPNNRPQSKIYNKLCRTLAKVAKNEAYDTKHVIIYTDLFENSELANFYNAKMLEAAATDPVVFAKKHFEKDCSFPDLDGVTVHLYPYRNAGTDAAVNKAQKFWVTLLENAGAEVEVDP